MTTATTRRPRRPYPRTSTLARAATVFLREQSPRLLTVSVVVLVTARGLVGRWSWVDAVVAGALVAFQPISEWLIHVFVLHVRPRGPVTRALDVAAGRSHREHHVDPTDLSHVFIHPYVTRATLGLAVVLSLLVLPRAPQVGTGLMTSTVLTLVYEWTHFVIHSDLPARSRIGRAVRRGHRLHHLRNEGYWFGVVTPVGDWMLRTAPPKRDVPVSATARRAGSSLSAVAR